MKSAATARIAFQGERGAFSEEAALKLLGADVTLVPCATFDATFSAIKRQAADYVLAPMENSLAGSVHRSFDLLVESGLHIVGEVIIPIVHNLIGVPRATLERIASVESHPVALAQCEQFFIAHPQLKRIPAEDTAGSVREVMRAADPTRAAIASRRAAELYEGVILLEHLEDDRENYTRFFLLAPSAAQPQDLGAASAPDKISLVFQLAHKPGALHHALEPFARRNINMMKIESRPVHGRPWQYRFYLDLQAAASDPEFAAALTELALQAAELKILGSYKSAETSPAGKFASEGMQ
ncbi:MAG TPA: prephenate dehydratase [Candidatus Acidoferrales bacterium]|jgi:prephenate dehydratase|nr:prephenate dehydratase [Candidatus Acidoferrales bacterium]